MELVDNASYIEPRLRGLQVGVYIIKDNTVLTVRHRTKEPRISGLLDELRGDTKAFVDDMNSELEFTSNKAFALSIVAEVNEFNWHLRDQFREWKVTIEESIRIRPRPGQSRHILDMDRTALNAVQTTEPYVQALLALSGGGAGKKKTTSPASPPHASRASRASRADLPPADDEEHTDLDLAQNFIAAERYAFRDTALAAERILKVVQYTREISTKLNEYYKHQMDESQNATLRLLTVITGTIFPMQLLTGVFGMNFEYMPELGYKWSYLIFWMFNVTVIILLIKFWHHRGMLEF